MISALHSESGDGYYAVGIASIAFNAVMFVCTTLLLLTALQDKKPKRLPPWLAFEFIGLILAFSSLLYGFYHILYTFVTQTDTQRKESSKSAHMGRYQQKHRKMRMIRNEHKFMCENVFHLLHTHEKHQKTMLLNVISYLDFSTR